MTKLIVEREPTAPHWLRALDHLKDFREEDNSFIADFELTQRGIAEALNISRPHATLILKQLTENEFAMARLSYIDDGGRRRLAYFITPKGFEVLRQRDNHDRGKS